MNKFDAKGLLAFVEGLEEDNRTAVAQYSKV